MFGDAGVRAYGLTVEDQRQALMRLAMMARRSIAYPIVKDTAHLIVRKCKSRDDECELTSIYYAVKNGDPDVPGLMHGLRYVHDPVLFDSFTAPHRLLEMGMRANRAGGAPGGDCDDATMLITALAGVLGFQTMARAYAPSAGQDFDHVYAVIGLPKNGPIVEWFGMDTTVPRAYPGWEPPRGHVLNAVVAGPGGTL